MIFSALLLGGSVLAAAQTLPGDKSKKLLSSVVGSWELSKILNGEKEVDLKTQPDAFRNIEFTEDAKYISRSPKLDSGFLTTKEDDMVLFLENATDDRPHPKEWKAVIDDKMLILSKATPSKMKKYKYVYVRKEGTEKLTQK